MILAKTYSISDCPKTELRRTLFLQGGNWNNTSEVLMLQCVINTLDINGDVYGTPIGCTLSGYIPSVNARTPGFNPAQLTEEERGQQAEAIALAKELYTLLCSDGLEAVMTVVDAKVIELYGVAS